VQGTGFNPQYKKKKERRERERRKEGKKEVKCSPLI
jgi:hypothetical protein